MRSVSCWGMICICYRHWYGHSIKFTSSLGGISPNADTRLRPCALKASYSASFSFRRSGFKKKYLPMNRFAL